LEIVTVQIISWNLFNVDLSTDFFAKGKKTDLISFQLAPSNYSCADQCYGMLMTYGMRSMVWFICFEKTVFYFVAL